MPQRVAVPEPRHAPAPLDRTVLPAPARTALHGAGRPIEAGLRRRMEAGFGIDFASVRIHDDASATLGLMEMRALGLAAGEHVALPGRKDDDRVLAHELTHVVQARAAAAGATRPGGDPEREAATAAAAILCGDVVSPITAAPGGPVQLLEALDVAQVTEHLQSGKLINQAHEYFSYVTAWWRAGGTPGATPPPGFVEPGGAIHVYNPGMTATAVERMPPSPASLNELRLALANYEAEMAARNPGAPPRGPQVSPAADELARIERAVLQARVQAAQGMQAPPLNGPGPPLSAAPKPGATAATPPELAATDPAPALAPAPPKAPAPRGLLTRMGQGARGFARRSAGRVADAGRTIGKALRYAKPVAMLAQVWTTAEAASFIGVDPTTMPEGAVFVDPGRYTSLIGRTGTVHHRPDGITELHFPKILLPMPQPEMTVVFSSADTT